MCVCVRVSTSEAGGGDLTGLDLCVTNMMNLKMCLTPIG